MNKTSFPYIPGQDTFVALGMNNRLSFFGCNSTNVTKGNNAPPIIVYLPNSPYNFFSNTSTFGKLSFSIEDRDGMIQNGYNMATQTNATRDGASNWLTCVGCVMLSRSLERNKHQVPEVCQRCFAQYCWNGTIVEKAPQYNPPLYLNSTNNDSSSGSSITVIPSSIFLSLLAIFALVH